MDADGSPSYDETTFSYLVLNSPGLEGVVIVHRMGWPKKLNRFNDLDTIRIQEKPVAIPDDQILSFTSRLPAVRAQAVGARQAVLRERLLKGVYLRQVVILGPDNTTLCITNTVSVQFLPP
ncbi:hypothetical protein [Hyalangium sp.]|uniref:hypothetical protein n=1 Tax=Hyalangium sp. TaxID=2028555 RepID=UPI002D64BA31|nr:hypothetical protein [Hyalangium sp.]HYH97680.1 hypothetical protein [Hyalangium sp.]